MVERMDFTDKIRALVITELALANRDPERVEQVIARLAELLAAALVVAHRDDQRALDQRCSALEAQIHREAVLKLEMLRALGADRWDEEPPT